MFKISGNCELIQKKHLQYIKKKAEITFSAKQQSFTVKCQYQKTFEHFL